MRNKIYYGLSVILVLAVIGTAAAIGNGSSAAVTNMRGHGAGFVDANGDGICDKFVSTISLSHTALEYLTTDA